jgi:hypothetical protein
LKLQPAVTPWDGDELVIPRYAPSQFGLRLADLDLGDGSR